MLSIKAVKKIYTGVMMGFFAMFSANIQAAGFALIEQSGSGLGNAYAGAAASAEDASTIYFNPAGMTYLSEKEMVFATHAIKLSAHFNNDGSIAGAGKSLGNEGGDVGDLALIPNFYYAIKLTPDLSAGISFNAPFGLKTEYDKNWLGRFQATKSEVRTLNINPSIAYKINDTLSIGVGISAMRSEAELNRSVNFGAVGEGAASVKGVDWGFGANIGTIINITPATRIGLAYRSQVKQNLKGTVRFRLPAAISTVLVPDGGATAECMLPDSFSISTFSQLNNNWDVMADVTWTGWGNFKELKILRNTGAILSLTPENWHDTLRYSIGANYRVNHQLKLRTGMAFDEEAISSQYRTASIPGNNRTWLAFGAQYQLTPQTAFDIGYAHLFFKDAPIADNQRPVNGLVKGKYEGNVDVLSVQLSHAF